MERDGISGTQLVAIMETNADFNIFKNQDAIINNEKKIFHIWLEWNFGLIVINHSIIIFLNCKIFDLSLYIIMYQNNDLMLIIINFLQKLNKSQKI